MGQVTFLIVDKAILSYKFVSEFVEWWEHFLLGQVVFLP